MSRGRSLGARRRAILAAAVALLAVAYAHALAQTQASARSYADPPDRTSGLDLAAAALGQGSSGELSVVIRTHAPWQPRDVAPSATQALCVWLRRDESPMPSGRLCVVPRDGARGGVGLRYTLLDHRGRRLGIRELAAAVRRPAPATISVRFSPALLRLAPGTYHWQVRSRSGGVEDRLPDRDEVALPIAVSTAPAARRRCFGAASRDPRRRCSDPALRRAVVPSPDDAVLSANSPCDPQAKDGLVMPCEFGVPAADARATIALVGDSHAEHWRAALEIIAQRKRWHGVSITRSGCPLSRATSKLEPPSRRAACRRWNRQLPAWFAAHRNVRTVFVVQHAAASVVVPDGMTGLGTRARGHSAAWKALGPSVRRIVVLRDTPVLGARNGCVQRSRARRENAGRTCAMQRARVLPADAAVVAARRLRSRRVRVIDMTPFFCGPKACFPVIGGALVYRDQEHLTGVYATTLSPYLQREIDRLR